MNKITAKAVLGELLEAYEQYEHGDYFYDHGDVVCEAVECILEQPQWISVEERLPEEALVGKYIIVCIKNRWNEQRVDTVHWWGPERMHGAAWFWSDVTHWMPLPKPPEEDGDKK